VQVGLVARPSDLTQWAPAKRKPEGPGRLGPIPSFSVSVGPPARLSTKHSTLSQALSGRMFQLNLITLQVTSYCI